MNDRLICPGNLIFGLNGKFDTIKLFDFSFAVKHRIDGARLVNILPVNKFDLVLSLISDRTNTVLLRS